MDGTLGLVFIASIVRRELPHDRTPCHTQPPRYRHKGVAGHFRRPLAITADAVGQDDEHRTARGARETSDGDPAPTDPEVIRGACQAPTSSHPRAEAWQDHAQYVF